MLRKRVLDAVYSLQRRMWRVVKPRTRGVKAMLFNLDGELVLVRNSYGRCDLFVLPGGGIRAFEKPHAAVRREMKEELGVEATSVIFRSLHSSVAEGKRDEIHLFKGRVGNKLKIDGIELAEAKFVSLDDLPPNTSPATRRRIEEYLGVRKADGSW